MLSALERREHIAKIRNLPKILQEAVKGLFVETKSSQRGARMLRQAFEHPHSFPHQTPDCKPDTRNADGESDNREA